MSSLDEASKDNDAMHTDEVVVEVADTARNDDHGGNESDNDDDDGDDNVLILH